MASDPSLGDDFFLLTTDELIDLRLLGPDSPTPRVRERLGDYAAIARGAAMLNSRGLDSSANRMASTHGGLTPQEVMVPVLLA